MPVGVVAPVAGGDDEVGGVAVGVRRVDAAVQAGEDLRLGRPLGHLVAAGAGRTGGRGHRERHRERLRQRRGAGQQLAEVRAAPGRGEPGRAERPQERPSRQRLTRQRPTRRCPPRRGPAHAALPRPRRHVQAVKTADSPKTAMPRGKCSDDPKLAERHLDRLGRHEPQTGQGGPEGAAPRPPQQDRRQELQVQQAVGDAGVVAVPGQQVHVAGDEEPGQRRLGEHAGQVGGGEDPQRPQDPGGDPGGSGHGTPSCAAGLPSGVVRRRAFRRRAFRRTSRVVRRPAPAPDVRPRDDARLRRDALPYGA
ncbi:hypothetical protein Nocox_11685 [Nonomuraea coxensis DSM 45129]|uniref:Uncharacterized protein n=1 Tax=Nonomuraea coxensis DSM 45129 TaxID=1122611 RepID=A0ABX8TWT2_9ACTN|nr:hypothetical protein Nocox_11685 [Nonomuraea coxensis DSM 45129]